MEEKNRLIEIVKEYQKIFNKTSEIYQDMLLRDSFTIMNSKSINYLCCTERHLIIAKMLAGKGIEPTPVLLDIKRPLQSLKLGCALEIKLDGEPYRFFSANSGGEVLKEGNYEVCGKIKRVTRAKFNEDPTNNWFSYFKKEDLAPYDQVYLSKLIKKIKERSSNSDLQRHLMSIAKNQAEGRSI